MNLKKFVDEGFIPDDGSNQILEGFKNNIPSSDVEMYVYPDIHHKRWCPVTNGLLIKSRNKIFPACLGVENCGFTVGEIKTDLTIEELQDSFFKYSEFFKTRDNSKYFNKIMDIFNEYLKKDYEKKKYFYSYIGYDSFEKLWAFSEILLSSKRFRGLAGGIGNMGGGNHFFELHTIEKSFDEKLSCGTKLYILHSDSIGFGNAVNLLYSNLSELDFLPFGLKLESNLKWRVKQLLYFMKNGVLFQDFYQLCKLLFSRNQYRTVSADTVLGKNLLLVHNIASVFGDMNRDCIVKEWADINNIEYTSWFSHPHDNVVVENIDGEYYVIHRNGVQYIGHDKYYMLPGAMGTKAYLLRNSDNKDAFYSANHGVGRMKDKHIARDCYTEMQTIQDLAEKKIKIYRLGDGDIAEQNYQAFKDVSLILNEMEKFKLGSIAAETQPFAVLKG